jgi:hypothetical protein
MQFHIQLLGPIADRIQFLKDEDLAFLSVRAVNMSQSSTMRQPQYCP